MNVALAGCGALGSWIAWLLAGNPSVGHISLFDDDRIEDDNLATTVYMEHQIGAQKATALAEMLCRKGHVQVTPVTRTVETFAQIHVSMPGREPFLVIDTFDNRESRMCTGHPGWRDTVHAGLSVERTGSVVWHQMWRPPPAEFVRGENPICTHHLGAQIIQLTAVQAVRVARRFLQTGERVDVPIILEDGTLI